MHKRRSRTSLTLTVRMIITDLENSFAIRVFRIKALPR